MTVTAQLMAGHEMALPPIMTECVPEKETEEQGSQDVRSEAGRVGGEGKVERK